MQPMSHDVRQLYLYKRDMKSGYRAKGHAEPKYTRSDRPFSFYFGLAERTSEQGPTGYTDLMEIPAVINGPAEISVGDWLGTRDQRMFEVRASVRIRSPYEQTQLRLRDII